MNLKVRDFCRAINGKYKRAYNERIRHLTNHYTPNDKIYHRTCKIAVIRILDDYLFDKDPSIDVNAYLSEEEMHFIAANLASYMHNMHNNFIKKWIKESS